MNRVLHNLAAFFFGFCLIFSAGFAFAEGVVSTVPASYPAPAPAYTYQQVPDYWQSGTTGNFPSASAACAAMYTGGTATTIDWRTSQCYASNGYTYSGAKANGICQHGSNASGCRSATQVVTCQAGFTHIAPNCVPVQSCPANSTQSGTNCVCAAGFDPVDGQCVARTCPSAGTTDKAPKNIEGSGNFCHQGCAYEPAGMTCTASGCISYSNRATGGTCNPATNATPANPTAGQCAAAGKGWAEINGVTSCSDNKTSETTTAPKTSTPTNPDGTPSGPAQESQKSTTCEGDNCTTTTKNPDGSGVVSTTTRAGFCEENPNSPMCKELKDQCKDNPDRLSCSEFGEVEDSELQTQNSPLPSSLSPVGIATNVSCPADVALPKGLTFSWAGACEFASAMYPIVLAIAWLSAGMILVGAFRES